MYNNQVLYLIAVERNRQSDCDSEYVIKERFLRFVNCNGDTGEEIADLILDTLKNSTIALDDCKAQNCTIPLDDRKAQSYDNGASMSGRYMELKIT